MRRTGSTQQEEAPRETAPREEPAADGDDDEGWSTAAGKKKGRKARGSA